MGLLSERVGEEYELASSTLPLGIFGKSEHEILRDKGKHVTLVYNSSINHRLNFNKVVFARESLTKFEAGPAPDGTGIQLVGKWTSFVDRKFVDGFVGCMRDVYNVPWETMHVWTLGAVRSGPLPVFLVSDPLSIVIAPYVFGSQRFEPAGKYQPLPVR